MARPKPKSKPLKSNPSPPPRDPHDVVSHDDIIDSEPYPPNEGEASASGSDSVKIEYLSPCIFYLYFGKCGNEDTCEFSHSPGSIDPHPPSGSTSPLSDGLPQSPKTSWARDPRPCKMFMKGSCKYGRRCKFPHENFKPSVSKFNDVGQGSTGGSGDRKSHSTERIRKNRKGAASAVGVAADELSTGFQETNARIEEISDDANEGGHNNTLDDFDQQYAIPYPKDSPFSESAHEAYTPSEDDQLPNDDRPPSILDSNHVDNCDADADTGEHSQLDSGHEVENQSQGRVIDYTYQDSEKLGTSVNTPNNGGPGEDEDSGADTWGWNETPKKKIGEVGGGQGTQQENSRTVGNFSETDIPGHWEDSSDAQGIAEEKSALEDVQEKGGEADWNDGLEYASIEGDNVEGQQANNDIDDAWHQTPEEEEEGKEGQDTAEDAGNRWEQAPERKVEEAKPENHEPFHSGLDYGSRQSNKLTASIKSSKNDVRTHAPSTPSLNPPPTHAQSPTEPTQTTIASPSAAPQAPPVSNARQISVMSLHWSRFADPTIDYNLAFCKAFAQNKCSNATSETCRFRHCLTPYEYTLLFKDPQPLQLALEKHLIRNDSPQDASPITSPSFALHWSHFADPTCDSNVAFCKGYAEHQCTQDNACKFRHCLTLEEYTLLFKDPQPNLIATGGAASQQPTSTLPSDPAHTDDPHAQNQSAQRPCAFFLKGTCRNGGNCRYRHDTSTSSCPNIRSQGYCNDSVCLVCCASPSNDQAPPVLPTKRCWYWSQGTCKNGTSCPFAHVGESGTAAQDDQGQNQAWRNGGNATQENQMPNSWGTNVNADSGNNDEGLDDQGPVQAQDKGKDKEEEEKNENDWGDYGWADQNNGASGWDDQNNDNSGWGKQNDDSGWGKQNDGSGWGKQNDDSGWGKQNNNSGWGTGRGTSDNVEAGTRRKDQRSNRRSWNENKLSTSRRASNICYRFEQEGRCLRGSDCRFSHDIQPGRSSSHSSREASQQHHLKNDSTSAAPPAEHSSPTVPSPRPVGSTYGGRHRYDRGFIDQWNREVAVSPVSSEVGDGKRRKGSSPQRMSHSRGSVNGTNRSVENPPAGNGSCQFYLIGRCSNGDTCPSSHDLAAEGVRHDVTTDEIPQKLQETRRSRRRSVCGGQRSIIEGDARGEGMNEDECTPHAENEDITANYDDASAQHHVIDKKWGLDDQWGDNPIEVPEEDIKIDKPCLYYGQGYCVAGNRCRYLHIDPEQPSPERSIKEVQPILPRDEGQDVSEAGTRDRVSHIEPGGAEARDYGHPLVERSIFGCAVVFDRDCLPDRITTGTDSQNLLLQGPPDITEARVHDAVNKYGPVEDIVITRQQPEPEEVSVDDSDAEEGKREEQEGSSEVESLPPPKSIIHVQFKEMEDAAAAARGLNGTLANTLTVEPASTTTTWVMFRWPQATRAAWVFYSTVTKAKAMAEKLHGTIFQDRKIVASFLRPDKRQKDLYAVKLEGLPASTSKEDLTDMVQEAKLVTISELTYIDNPREVLQRFEGLKAFVDVSEDPSRIKAVAFARFDSEKSVSQALSMHGAKPKFLGKQELVVERAWFAYYTLPTGAFKAVSTQVAALHIQCEGRAHIESADVGEYRMIYLYSPDEEKSTFANANLSLQAICHGTVIMTAENRREWDEYLYSTSSGKVIESLNARDRFYIFSNTSARQIHVLGSGVDRDKGVSAFRKLLQKVRASCQTYPIHRNIIRQLVNGGFSEIQDSVGANKLSLDVLRSVLVVRGVEKVLGQKIRHILEFAPSSEARDRSNCSDHLCSVCELRPGGDGSNVVIKLSCGHVYCMSCLQYALIFATQDHSAPIKCIGRILTSGTEDTVPCAQPITYATARDLLPLLIEPEYLKIAFITYVLSRTNEYFFCPSLHCDTVYRHGVPGDTARCPICKAWICLFCRSMTHDGIDCKGAQEIRKTIRN